MNIEDVLKLIQSGDIDESQISSAITGLLDEEVSGLKNKNHELLSTIKRLKTSNTNSPLSESELDEYTKLKLDHDNAEEQKLKDSKQWDSLRKNLITNHNKEKEKLTLRESQLKQIIQGNMLDGMIASAITEENGRIELLTPHVKNSMKVIEKEDGSFEAIVINQDGDVRLDEVTGKYYTVKQLVSDMKKQESFAPAFVNANSGGGGGGNNTGGSGIPNSTNPFKKGTPEYSLTEQVRLTKTDPILAKQLRDQAIST